MKRTPFPVSPAEVVTLTPQEFSVDLDLPDLPLDAVCGRFVDDANRALVWLVRFRALRILSERPGMAEWLRAGPRTASDVCEIAAGFHLNERWEFDRDGFCSAVDALASRRSSWWRL